MQLAEMIIRETVIPDNRKNRDRLARILSNTEKAELVLMHCRTGRWEIFPPPYWWDYTKIDDEWTTRKGTESFIVGRWEIK